jgi:hypothetical protein
VRKVLARMDLRWRLGLDPAAVKRSRTVPGWLWLKRAKSRNPLDVVLVRVGRDRLNR